MEQQTMKIQDLTLIALMAALTCILGPMSITLPFTPVPISFTNLVIYFAVMVIGMKRGTISYLVYLLIGAVGLPVFSGYAGGLGKLAGPTGGYLIGFIPMIIIGGLLMEKSNRNLMVTSIGWVFGTAVAYFLGTIWFVHITHSTVMYALTVCVFPFIIADIAKIVIGTILGREVRKGLIKAGIFANGQLI